MKLAVGVIAILVFPVVVYAIDPAHRTPLFPIGLGTYLALGLGLVVLSLRQRPAVRPDQPLDERALDRRLTVGALLVAIVISNFTMLQARAATPFISGLAVAWSLVWLPRFSRRVSVTTRVLVNRDVKTVFGFMADMRNQPQYTPDVVSVEKITEGDIGPGTQFRSTVRMGDAGTFQGVEQIVEMEWGRRIKDSLVSGRRPNYGELTFDPQGSATLVSYRFVSEVSYPSALLGAGVLRWLAIGQMRRRRMQAWLRLKQVLESRPDA